MFADTDTYTRGIYYRKQWVYYVGIRVGIAILSETRTKHFKSKPEQRHKKPRERESERENCEMNQWQKKKVLRKSNILYEII